MRETKLTKEQILHWIACAVQVAFCVIGILAAIDHEVARNNKQRQKMAAWNTKMEIKKKKAEFKMQNKLDRIARRNRIRDEKRAAKAKKA